MGTLKLNKSIYEREAVAAAISAFGEVATISLTEDNSYWICSFDGCRYDEKQTLHEFENYVIDFMNTL